MKRRKLREGLDAVKSETKEALETVLSELNQGQRKKIEKIEEVRALLNRYGVEVSE